MQSKRKPYFSGNTVKIKGDGAEQILYARYTDHDQGDRAGGNQKPAKRSIPATEDKPINEKKRKDMILNELSPSVLVEKQSNASASEPQSFEASPVETNKQRKKPRWSEEKKAAAKAEREASKKVTKSESEPKKKEDARKKQDNDGKKKKEVIRALAPEERISGPSNADEAAKIRETLGFATVSEQVVAQKQPTGGQAFAFGFGLTSSKSAEDNETEEEEEEESEGLLQKEEESDKGSDDESSSSDDESSSSDEEEEEHEEDEKPQHQQQNTTATPVITTNHNIIDSEYVPRRVYVGGMPYTYTEALIKEFWEYCGPIESMDMLTFPDTGRFRGIVFITFATEEGYNAALACDGEACEGQTVKVQKCKWSAKDKMKVMTNTYNKSSNQKHQDNDGKNDHGFTDGQEGNNKANDVITPGNVAAASLKGPAPKTAGYDVAYVGNIAWEADEEALRALFEPFGVTKVRLHTDKDTGKPKGFAHVHFKDEESLDAAMSLDGTLLMGRRIRVGYAQPKRTE